MSFNSQNLILKLAFFAVNVKCLILEIGLVSGYWNSLEIIICNKYPGLCIYKNKNKRKGNNAGPA